MFSAPDVHTVSGAIPAGGTATVVFSRDRNAGVLVMNDAAPLAGQRLPDVAGQLQRREIRRDDGLRSRSTVDHRGPRQSRRLDKAGVHRRTRNRIDLPHRDRYR